MEPRVSRPKAKSLLDSSPQVSPGWSYLSQASLGAQMALCRHSDAHILPCRHSGKQSMLGRQDPTEVAGESKCKTTGQSRQGLTWTLCAQCPKWGVHLMDVHGAGLSQVHGNTHGKQKGQKEAPQVSCAQGFGESSNTWGEYRMAPKTGVAALCPHSPCRNDLQPTFSTQA